MASACSRAAVRAGAGCDAPGIAGTHREAALACAARFGLDDVERADALLARPDVELVYIATPPFLHYAQARAALRAGKHVIVEKPLAITVEQADELVALARDTRRLLVTNLMQRYNPLFAQVKRWSTRSFSATCCTGRSRTTRVTKTCGGPLVLGPDEERRDLHRARRPFLRPVRGLARRRESSSRQVGCCVPDRGSKSRSTAPSATVTARQFYHGFTQPGRMDRQELRLVFERGDVTLREWIPTQAVVHTALDEASTRALRRFFLVRASTWKTSMPRGERVMRGRHKTYEAYQRITLTSVPATKMTLYGDLLRALLADQLAFIAEPSHVRVVTEDNGRESLRMSVRATQLAAAS